jgi:predicted TIM-barrel fold metal-dependent hydrolase
MGIRAEVESLGLFDHHCHGVVAEPLDRAGFEAMLTEGGPAGRWSGSRFDSRAGLAVRRWCAPVLDLLEHAPAADYLARRAELGPTEVNRRLLTAAGLTALCVDTGFTPRPLTTPTDLATLAGAAAHRIARLESLAEEVLSGAGTASDGASDAGSGAAGFAAAFRERVGAEMDSVVGWKSIAAYRAGLALPADPPGAAEVTAAADRALGAAGPGGRVRVSDPVLHAFLVHTAVETGKPVQFHVGYGDTDVNLDRCDPLLLTDLIRRVAPAGVPIMLLHNYPYHRQAAYLAQVFDPVFVDLGLATHNAAGRAAALLAETLELAPFAKVLFSSDAFGLAELYLVAATLFRDALATVLDAGIDAGDWTTADAQRFARMIACDTARRAYGNPAPVREPG